MPNPEPTTVVVTPDPALEPTTPAEDELLDHMIRRPTEADFADVLTPEGNSGDVFGSDVSDSVIPSNDSLGGTL